MALLFDRDVKTIGKHINNALNEELFLDSQSQQKNPVVAKFATTANDGKTYQVEYYNLDVILSVGYRVKSNKGILFRRWVIYTSGVGTGMQRLMQEDDRLFPNTHIDIR